MKIPKVHIDISDMIMSNVSIYIEVQDGISDQLMEYIKAIAKGFTGFAINHNLQQHMQQRINSNLTKLAYSGQLFQAIDGTWDVDGFLWVDNEY